jgi:hypothetical protein
VVEFQPFARGDELAAARDREEDSDVVPIHDAILQWAMKNRHK